MIALGGYIELCFQIPVTTRNVFEVCNKYLFQWPFLVFAQKSNWKLIQKSSTEYQCTTTNNFKKKKLCYGYDSS